MYGTIMKKGFVWTILLIALFLPAFAYTVSPNSISDSIKLGEQKSFTITINNTESNETTFYINKTGSLANWIFFSTTALTLQSGHSGDVSVLVSVPSSATEGVYNGTIGIYNGSVYKTVQISINAIKWVYDVTRWFSENDEITIQPYGFTFTVDDVGRDVITSVGNFSVGDVKEVSGGEIELSLMDRYEDQARFRVRTTDASTSISSEHISTTQSSGEETCSMEPLINKYVLAVQQGVTTRKILTIRNTGTDPVDLKDFILEDVIQTPSGTKPISAQADLGRLESGQETSLTITIDTDNLDPGTYTPSIVIVGYCGNVRSEARVNFDLTVIEKLVPETFNMTVSAPSSVEVDQQFTITVGNIPSDATVSAIEPSGVSRISFTRSGSSYTWIGKATKAGDYTITFIGSKKGMTDTKSVQISAQKKKGQLSIEIMPPNPQDGNTVTVVSRDSVTHDLVSSTITVTVRDPVTSIVQSQFTYTAPFQVNGGKQYCFSATASNYNPISRCITVSSSQGSQPQQSKQLVVEVTPDSPVEGDDVKITVKDQSGNVVQSAKIKVNDVWYNEPSITLPDVASGLMNLYVTANGYTPAQKAVQIGNKPTLVSEPEVFNFGSTVYWNYTAPVSWEVQIDNATVLSGKGKSVGVTLSREGTYQIYVQNSLVKTFTVRKGLMQKVNLGGIFQLLILGVAGFLLFAFIGSREGTGVKKYKKRRVARVASMSPKSPPASEPVSEDILE